MIKRLLIIPARVGSKRIKNKNFKKFNGKPIIFYSIESALNQIFSVKFMFLQIIKKLILY